MFYRILFSHIGLIGFLACLTSKTYASEALAFGAINVAPYAAIENQVPNGLYVEFINQLSALSGVAFSIKNRQRTTSIV